MTQLLTTTKIRILRVLYFMLSRDLAGLSPLLLLAGHVSASLSIDIGPRDTILQTIGFI